MYLRFIPNILFHGEGFCSLDLDGAVVELLSQLKVKGMSAKLACEV